MKHLNMVLNNPELVDADICEIGVYRGGTLDLIAKRVQEVGWKGVVRGFDTFTGLPTPTQEDLGVKSPHAKGDFADTSITKLVELLPPGVQLHQGRYPDDFLDLNLKLAFVHLDVDFHDEILQSLYEIDMTMCWGGIVVVDDYNWHRTPGVKTAVDSFLAGPTVSFKLFAKAENQVALRLA
jgi:hypothetical protein